jgi:hypothetical protein
MSDVIVLTSLSVFLISRMISFAITVTLRSPFRMTKNQQNSYNPEEEKEIILEQADVI